MRMFQAVRRFWKVQAAALLLGGLVLLTGQPASAQSACTSLNMLTWAHFIRPSDQYLSRLASEFGKQHGIKVQISFVALNDVPTKLAAAAYSKSGPDIVLLMNYSTALYKDVLLPLDDVVLDIQKQHGLFVEVGREASRIDGVWRSVPWFVTPAPGNVRKDYFAQAGLDPVADTDTWSKLLAAATKLKAAGHPVGLPISHAGDANDWLLALLNSFGAQVIDASGNVAIDSPETRKALDYIRQLAKQMPPDVFGWDGGGNNRFILSGTGAYTINPASIYIQAKKSFPDIAKNLVHVPPPAGPRGRYTTTTTYTLGVTSWSKCPDLAKAFLEFLFEPENLNGWIEASGGYNVPLFQKLPDLGVWRDDPNMKAAAEVASYLRLPLWPAPPAAGAQKIYDLYIIPDMFARAARGESNDRVIAWAKEQLQKAWLAK